jgi:hypothetical protein
MRIPIQAFSMGAYDDTRDYHKELDYILLRNIEALAVGGFQFDFVTVSDESAFQIQEADTL